MLFHPLEIDSMNAKFLFGACVAAAATTTFAAGPFGDAFKGKMKPGLYEVRMEMEMPGMPQGMGKQQMTMQNCVTAEDLEGGKLGRSEQQKMEQCEVKNFKMSGNTASYTTVCKGDMQMTADTTVTFAGDGYRMDMKMSMNQGGQVMKMNQKMDGRYLGACKK
jgi:hypothetical protein